MKKGKQILPKGQSKSFINWQELLQWMEEHRGNHPPTGYVASFGQGEDGNGVLIRNT